MAFSESAVVVHEILPSEGLSSLTPGWSRWAPLSSSRTFDGNRPWVRQWPEKRSLVMLSLTASLTLPELDEDFPLE
jgi:hypothetical protein